MIYYAWNVVLLSVPMPIKDVLMPIFKIMYVDEDRNLSVCW